MNRPGPWIAMLAPALAAFIVGGYETRTGDAQTPAGETVAASQNVMVPIRDGVRLATDIYFPAKSGIALEDRRPVILERTPY